MTDHKAEAIRISQLAHDNADEEKWDRAVHQMLRAQMHATLYLAEQQQIANTLTYYRDSPQYGLAEETETAIREALL